MAVFDNLKADPQFRTLSVRDQIEIGRKLISQELSQDPQYQQLNLTDRFSILNRILAGLPTFQDPGLEDANTLFGKSYVSGGSGLEKSVRDFFDNAIANSGILGFVDQQVGGGKMVQEDRKRSIDYYRELDRLANRQDPASELGSLTGNITDIIGVSLATAPLTGAASGAIQTFARGGAAQVAKAASLGLKAPILHPLINTYGPVLAESTIEAIPYLLTTEQQRIQKGEPSVLGGSTMDIAKTLGVNAAADFLVGSVVTGAFPTIWKTGKAIFGKSDVFNAAKLTENQMDKLLFNIETGVDSPEILQRLPKIDKAVVEQRLSIARYVREGIKDPNVNQWGKISLLASDTKRIIENTGDGFNIYELAKDGRPITRPYQSITDAENYLSYRFYVDRAGVDIQDLPKVIRPDNAWAYERGRTLVQQQSLFENTAVKEMNPELFNKLKAAPKGWQNPAKRPVITEGEADAISRLNSSGITIKTTIPLQGSVTEAANKADVELLRGQGPLRVKVTDEPNAFFIGVKEAPPQVYEAATIEGSRLAQAEPFRTPEVARATLLLNNGYDFFRHPDGSVEFFTPRNMKLIGSDSDVLIPTKSPVNAGPVATQAVVSDGIRGVIRGKAALRSDDIILDSMLKSIRTSDPTNIQTFSKFYLSAHGLPDNVAVRRLANADDLKVRRLDNGTIEISIGNVPRSYSSEQRYIQNLIDGLNDVIPEGSKLSATKTGAYYRKLLSQRPTSFGLPEGVDKANWIDQVVRDIGGEIHPTADGIRISLLHGNGTFTNVDDAINFIARKTVDPTTVRNDLLEQGVRVFQTKDNYIARTIKGGNELGRGKTFSELLDAMAYVPSKLDIRYGPQVVSLGDDGISFVFNNNVYTRSSKDAFQAIARFENKGNVNQLKILGSRPSRNLSIEPNGLYRVKLSDYDIVKEFDNAVDARRYFQTEIHSLDEIKDIANQKFLDFDIQNGKYVINDGTARFEFNNMDDLKAKMAEYPDISNSVNDIVPLDPQVESTVPELVQQYGASNFLKKRALPNPYKQPPEFPQVERVKEMSTWLTFRKNTSEFFSWMESVATKTNNPYLVEWSNKMQLNTRRARLANIEVNKFLESAFRGRNGRILNRESRQRIFYWGSAEPGSEEFAAMQDLYKKSFHKELKPLNDEEQAALTSLQQLYDSLGRKCNIDYNKLIKSYMPRLRRHFSTLTQEEIENAPTLMRLANTVPEWHGNLPKEIKFWAENERTADLPQFFLRDDAYEVALSYASQGHKKFYLNDSWKEIDRFMKETGLEEGARGRILMYKADIMGGNHSDGERAVAEIGSKLFRGIKRKLGNLVPYSENDMAQFGHDIMGNMLGLNYFVSLGWKPFLAVRNTMQPLTTLAPRFGIDWTLRAWKDLAANPEPVVARLRKVGILKDKPPIVNSLFGGESRTGRFTQLAFQWFKNSDDWTRAVAFHTASMRLDNAIAARQLMPTMTPAKFMELAGLDRIHPQTAQEIMARIEQGAIEGARDQFGDIVQRATMFDYNGATAPAIHRGLIGKLFGQYGTFAAGYRANMAGTFQYHAPGAVGVKQVLGSLSTYLAVSSALWAGFESLRIKTNDFIPFAPGIFTGGPGFDVALNVIRASDPLSFEGKEARAALQRDLPTFLPGSTQYKAVKRTLDFIDQGDAYAAVLSLLNAPVVQ